MSLTFAFAEHLQRLSRAGLDDLARQAAASLFRDGIAVAAAGAAEQGPRLLRDMALASATDGAASMIGEPRRVSVAEAARANGAAMHVLDWEPMWNPANHALSTTLPAVLALSEATTRNAGPFPTMPRFAVTGERLLTALAIGIEAQARLRLASGQLDPGSLKFHPPGVVGPIGAAAACGLLLNLDAERLAYAIGIAASRAAGVQGNIGSMTKALHCGQAAASGLESALLAASGFTADADALGGPRGYGRAFYGEGFDAAHLTAETPQLHIVSPGPAYKLFPSQYGTHFAITAALEARSKMPVGATPRRVRLTTPVMAYIDRPRPATGLAGKFSLQYVTAAALLDGRVDVASFTDARRFAPDMEAMLGRIEVVQDPTRSGRFDGMSVDIEVELGGAQRIKANCDGPPGIWGRPVATERLQVKARDCLVSFAGVEKALQLETYLEAIAHMDATKLVVLMDALAAPAM